MSIKSRYDVVIGIDPGVRGGIAILKLPKLNVYPMPIIGEKEYNMQLIKTCLKGFFLPALTICYIERQHCMPGEGLPRTFKTGFGFGMLQGILTGLEIPFVVVNAKEWQKEMFKGLPKDQDTKVSSALVAQRLFPKNEFRATERSRTIADGMTDAACIAEYGMRVESRLVTQAQACIHRVRDDNPDVCVVCGDIV